MREMIEDIRNKAKGLLSSKRVDIVIGYKRAADGISATPAFIEKSEDAECLIWDAYCVYNLANYLNPARNTMRKGTGPVVSSGVKDLSGKKIGIIAKGCDTKAITVLLQENQIKREDIVIIGVECSGVIDGARFRSGGEQDREPNFREKCKGCRPSTPAFYDILIKETKKIDRSTREEQDDYEAVRKLEIKSLEERFKLWQEEFSRCIRCYACRQVCPMCYCPRCVADQIMPAWFSKGTSFEGNFSWNVTRAMHLAGRCVDCGECGRACPVGIPLREINKKIQKDVKELFNYEAGSGGDQKPLFSCFDKNDPGNFIK